jgi:hypothetical protein
MATRHLAMVKTRVRFPVSARWLTGGFFFESGRSLAVLAQLVEAQVLGIWRSGFESPGRYSWRANRTGAGRRC